MRRRHAALLLALLAACGEPPPPPDTRPDLLLVVIDTLRADHLSGYGYARPTSPALDAFGAEGAVFLDDTSQSSWTLPSVASILSGRHLFVNAKRVPPTVPTVAERLRAVGYETAAFLGNPAITRGGGYDRGFEHFIGREVTADQTWNAPMLQQVLADWLSSHPRDGRPRFLYLHFMDPHWPYEPPAETTVSGTVRLRDDTLVEWTQAVKLAGPGTPLYDHLDEDRRYIIDAIDRYDREVATADGVLGQLFETLRAAAGPRALFSVVGADHGEMLWDHRHHPAKVDELPPEKRTLRELWFRDHSYHMFQELVHVPLLVVGPGIPSGQRVATPVENVDIVPTLLRAAGLPDDPDLSGRALQDVLAGSARPRTAIYAFAQEATLVRRADTGFKLIFPTPTGDSLGMPAQLYQLKTDKHERDNLFSRNDAATREVLRGLIGLREQAAASFHLYDKVDATHQDTEQERILKELGYIGTDGGTQDKAAEPEDGEVVKPEDEGR